MTAKARVVLEDCRQAIAELTDDLQGAEWRLRWVTVVTLLRAVGHVLYYVDRQTSPVMQDAVDQAWSHVSGTKPRPEILWGFIDEDRHAVIKEYRFTAGQGVKIFPPPLRLSATFAGRPSLPSPIVEGRAEFVYEMGSGPFSGRDPRAVAREAVDWWQEYLDAIDAAASP